MSPVQPIPLPDGSERDSEGRLIKLVFESSPPPPDAGANPWLIAVDGSDNALRALAHAATLAGEMKACALHLVHVQPWLSKEAAETELARFALEATEQARKLLDARALPWRLHVVMGEPAERILEQVARLHATCIIMGSRGLNRVESLVFGSVTYKVMHRSRVPVMVVP